MTTLQAIKQLEERNVASEITLMVWSDRMDLVALANIKGEVSLHRLTWTKAWTLNAPKDGVTVKRITWRPDGKIIGIAYTSGQIILVKVENKNILHTIETKSDVSCMCWTQEKTYNKKSTQGIHTVAEESKQKQYMKYIESSSYFLPELPNHQFDAATSEDTQKPNLLQEQNYFNLLFIGTFDGIIHVRIFGCFPCSTLNLNAILNCECTIESIHLIDELNKMFVTVRDANSQIKIIVFNSNIFKSHMNELFAIALKQIKLMSLMNYLSSTITTITESWESILLEMDNKLSKYASNVPEGGVTADFLDLLMFGICSDEMKVFLIHDLTKRGLEKFGQTIEMSYSNIQKLLLKYVIKFGQNITYHLAEMRGMARLEDRYKILGLKEESINEAILANGAFLIKGGEMQQIINYSIINYKAFFRWLFTAIMHVMEEPIPIEIPKMTQQDLAYITEFLQNFDNIGNGKTSKKTGFIMERLGQYLSDTHLTIPPDMSGNDWANFLDENKCIQNHSSILKHYRNMSLVQQYKHLKISIDNIFATPKEYISQQFGMLHEFNCFSYDKGSLKMSQINISKDTILFAFLYPPENVYLLQIEINVSRCKAKSASIHFTLFSQEQENSDEKYNVLDLQIYSTTILTVLLQDNSLSKISILNQIPLNSALEQISELVPINEADFFVRNCNIINGSLLTPRLFKYLEGIIASNLAVSGSRKVGIVLAENRRKVRLYEMEREEEDDEDADMTNTTLKETSDLSLHDSNISKGTFCK